MFDRKVVIWTGGGIIAGYALNSALQRVFFSTDSSEQDSRKKLDENGFGNDNNVNDSGFSNLTLELGSPTSSSVIESTEYPLYSPKENYPDIDGNK